MSITIHPASEFKAGESIGFFDLPDKDYFRAPGLSQSLLKHAVRSPQHARQAQRCPMVATDAMELGTLCHTLLLQPNNFGEGKSHITQPKEYPSEDKKLGTVMKRWSGNANWCKAWQEENADKVIMSEKELTTVHNMADSFKFDPLGAQLLKHGFKEVAGFWIDEESGLMMKMKLDLFAPLADEIMIVDLKKVGQEEEYAFKQALADLDYPLQGGQYRIGVSILTGMPLDKVRFVHASIPDKAPHCISFTEMLPNTRRKGEERMRQAVTDYKAALDGGEWSKITYIEAPDYYLNK